MSVALKADGGLCWRFIVDLAPSSDAVVRVLAAFPPQGADLARVRLDRKGGDSRLEIEAHELDPQKADHLRLRLQQLPAVRSVAVGWR